jgi:hypothetical protein
MHRRDAIFKASKECPGERIVLFDWDGTIVDSMPAVFEADGAVCRQIGVPFDESIFRCTFSPNWRLMYRALVPGRSDGGGGAGLGQHLPK